MTKKIQYKLIKIVKIDLEQHLLNSSLNFAIVDGNNFGVAFRKPEVCHFQKGSNVHVYWVEINCRRTAIAAFEDFDGEKH